MNNSRGLKFFESWLTGTAVVVAVVLVMSVSLVLAAPPGTPYNLGETLQPTCVPGSANCTVVTPAASGANSDITSLSGLTTPLSMPQGGTGLGTIPADRLIYTSALDTFAPLSLSSMFSFAGASLNLVDDTVTEVKLDVNNAPSDGAFLKWNNATTEFIWGAEADPEVGANTANYLSKWDGSALVSSMVYDDGNNLGIGFGSPIYSLDILRTTASAGQALRVRPDNGDSNFEVYGYLYDAFMRLTNANSEAIIKFGSENITNQGWAFVARDAGESYRLDLASGVDVSENDDDKGLTRVTILQDGKVGIGEINPSVELDVAGTMQQSNAYMFAYDMAGGTVIPTTWVDITFDSEVREDLLYTHAVDSAEFEINGAGWYLIITECGATVSDNTRSHADWRLIRDSGSGFNEVLGTAAATYHRNLSDGSSSMSITRMIQLNTGDKLKLQGMSDRATQVSTLSNSCRMLIERK